MNAVHDVWTDPDVIELVRDEPELAAIADAIAVTLAGASKRRRLPPSRLAALAVAVAAALAAVVALAGPWYRTSGSRTSKIQAITAGPVPTSGAGMSSSGPHRSLHPHSRALLADEALAAIGSDPVLHVVVTEPTNVQLVDLQSGSAQPVLWRSEIWYDASLGVERTTRSIGDALLSDELLTKQGAYTPNGFLAPGCGSSNTPAGFRIVCNPAASGTPAAPQLNPALADFITGYAQALANGQAQAAGSGTVDGQPVDWLVFPTAFGSEKVALDQTTHKPVLIEQSVTIRVGQTPQTTEDAQTVETIETIPYEAANFARPPASEIKHTAYTSDESPEQALPLTGTAIGATLAGSDWAGPSIDGLPLAGANQLFLYVIPEGGSTQTGTGVELDYGAVVDGQPDRSQPYVEIMEEPSEALVQSIMWGRLTLEGLAAPPAGELYEETLPQANVLGSLGFTVHDGNYVTIQASSQSLLYDTARALTAAS